MFKALEKRISNSKCLLCVNVNYQLFATSPTIIFESRKLTKVCEGCAPRKSIIVTIEWIEHTIQFNSKRGNAHIKIE